MRQCASFLASPSICHDGLLKPYPDAAQFLGGISRGQIYALMADGSICYTLVGADRKIPKAALVEYAERNLVRREVA